MSERLDKKVVRDLIEEADRKWFSKHATDCDYQGHLDFVSDYLVRNYGRRSGQTQRAGG